MKYDKFNADQWVKQQIMKLSVSDYRNTFYAIAHLTALDGFGKCTSVTEDVVVPVKVFEHEDPFSEEGKVIGFEVLSLDSLAGQCKWPLYETWIDLDTDITHVHGKLEEMIEESMDLYGHLESIGA